MKSFKEILNESPSSNILNNTAKEVRNVIGASLKKINKKDIKDDFESLKKLNFLQTTYNKILSNF